MCWFSRLLLTSLEHFGFSNELGTSSASACSISSWNEDELLCIRICRTTKQLQTQRASCFLPGIKVAAVYLWGSLQGVGPTAWSWTRGRWGWLTFRWSSSPRQGSTEIQSWSYTDRPHNIEMVTKLLQLQLPSLTTPSCRFHRSCFKRMESNTVLNKLCRVVPRLIANFLSFLFKNKNYTIFACFQKKIL